MRNLTEVLKQKRKLKMQLSKIAKEKNVGFAKGISNVVKSIELKSQIKTLEWILEYKNTELGFKN